MKKGLPSSKIKLYLESGIRFYVLKLKLIMTLFRNFSEKKRAYKTTRFKPKMCTEDEKLSANLLVVGGGEASEPITDGEVGSLCAGGGRRYGPY